MKITKPKVPGVLWVRNGGKDIVLNVTFKDAIIRFLIMVFLPLVVMIINVHLVIYTAPIITYLFISAIVRFCVIKYLWHHYIEGERTPAPKAYGKDLNYPEESV